ncbi:MAG: phosphotyrosine protein phosphatase [Gammaproteobacteria bacterium]|nr:phosphotyrosine protein phosphatase [Gammaproteobacteria bacterium]
MKKLLFVCSENRLRSPTAERVFSEYNDIEAIGAGTNSDASTPVTGDLIEWADIILVMEKAHRNKISKKYKKLLGNKRLIVLDIPDNYEFMQPELIQLLKSKVSKVVRL